LTDYSNPRLPEDEVNVSDRRPLRSFFALAGAVVLLCAAAAGAQQRDTPTRDVAAAAVATYNAERTLRAARRDLPSLREHRVAAAIGLVLKRHGAAATAITTGPHAPGARGAALARRLRTAGRLRVVHFSIEPDHVHLLVEAVDAVALGRGLQGLSSQLARRVNAALGRCGQVFADRYHAHALRAPREVRNALVYVLQNHRKHVTPARGLESPFPAWVDPLSSAAWFDGWLGQPGPLRTDAPPVVPARTWLAAAAWRRHGLVHPAERPRVGR